MKIFKNIFFLCLMLNVCLLANAQFSNFNFAAENALIAQKENKNQNQKKANNKNQQKKNAQKKKNQKNKQQAKNKNQNKQNKNQQQKKNQNKDTAATNKQAKKKKIKGSSIVREEIQRYLGYEDLLTRYLTVPYDITMNSNVEGYYIDIGFFLLMFLPIILIIGLNAKPIYGYIVMGVCFIVLILSTSNGIIIKNAIERVESNPQNLSSYIENTAPSADFVSYLIANIYLLFETIASPLNSLINAVSGDSDSITYPLLVLLFLFLFYVVEKRIEGKSKLIRSISLIVLFFMFLWFLLAAGIVWYGYLMLPMGTLFIWAVLSKMPTESIFKKVIFGSTIAISFLWIMLALTLRVSNIYSVGPATGVHLFDAPIVKYQTGNIDAKEVIQSYFPGLNSALKTINRNEEALVYSAGTMFPFFIEKNDERLIEDNLLAMFTGLNNRMNNKVEIANAMKASGIKYILINLNLPKIDRTPEKTVVKKFEDFINFIYKNPQLEFLASDRIIEDKNSNGAAYNRHLKKGENDLFFEAKRITSGKYVIYAIK